MPTFFELALKPFHCATLLGSSLLFSLSLQAQPAESLDILRRPDGTPELVRFEPAEAPPSAQAAQVLHHTLHLGRQSEMRPLGAAESDANGLTIQRFQQYYQGLPVEFTRYQVLSRNGRLELISGEVRELPDGALGVQPRLTAAAALPAALAFVHAQKYMWQTPHEGDFARQTEGKSTFRPTGELVIVDNELARDRPGKPVLAWKFDIYATQPVSRDWIYVDAQTGKVVNQDAIIRTSGETATVATKYSGTRTLANYRDIVFLRYYLHDYSRGQGIETYNAVKSNNLYNAQAFFDGDNNWTAAEYNNTNQDWIAGDAFFGAQQAYDYWLNVHNRYSFNNAGRMIKSYVHYDATPGDGKGYDNAHWNGSALLYGDGDAVYKPLASLVSSPVR